MVCTRYRYQTRIGAKHYKPKACRFVVGQNHAMLPFPGATQMRWLARPSPSGDSTFLGHPPSVLCVGLSPRILDLLALADDYLTDKQQPDGWHTVTNEKHLLAHRILSQVIYRSVEPPNREKNEVVFAAPDPQDVIYLLWSDHCAVGFCTIKPKGSQFRDLHEQYAVTTLDTVFVRNSHRRRGHVSALLNILASQYGDIGFSQPISDAMLKVIEKFLTVNKQCRRTFWEVTGNGEEGNRKLIWFQLRRTNQAPCKTPRDQCTCRRAAVKSSGQA